MASSTNRDVKVTVTAEAAGGDSLRGLAGDMRGVGTAAEETAVHEAALTRAHDQSIATLKEKRAAEAAARAELASLRKVLDDNRDALARLKAATDPVTRATAEHQAKVAALKLAVVEAGIAHREQGRALGEATAEAKAAAAAEARLASEIKRASETNVQNLASVGSATSQVVSQFGKLQTVIGAVAGGALFSGLTRDLATTADAYNNLAAKVELTTGRGVAFDQAFAGVFDVATRTSTALETTGTLFTKIAEAGKNIGVTNAQALALTETINQAAQLSGASAEAANAAVTQLNQGLQSGVLRGDEFNSVMEQAPRLAKALADGLGVTTGELRKLAEAGRLTSETVIKSLQGQAQAVEAEFSKLPPTVGRALQNLETQWTRYVGEVDKANGISAKAAQAIAFVAQHLDALGKVLLTVGEAWAGYKALDLAAVFLRQSTATATATAAVTAHTAATVANTTAQQANAAASAAQATAGANAAKGATATLGLLGRLTGAIGLVVTAVVLLGDSVVRVFKTSGTWIGEGIAKLQGYKDKSEDLLAVQKAQEHAAGELAKVSAQVAQQMEREREAALGLTPAAQQLVADFEQMRQKGESSADALGKLVKALDLGDLKGIAAAGAALDVLAIKGQLSASQVREAWAQALKGDDLLRFETIARAAFDGSNQGARRLQAVLDGIADESLRRAGTSVDELKTGFTKATTSAINDLDILARTLRELKAPADETGRVLTAAIDKSLAAANTERAVEAVIERITALGKEGLLTGDKLATALDGARKKLDDLRPGVNSLTEAFRTLGLKAPEEAARIADSFKKAYEVISTSGTATIQDKIAAFTKYREAAIAANGGVESSEIAMQRRILESQAAARGLGDEFERAMGRAERATRKATDAITEQRNALAGSLSQSFDANKDNARSIIGGPTYDKDGFATDSTGQRITAGTQLTPPDGSGDWQFISDVRANGGTQTFTYQGKTMTGIGVPGQGYWVKPNGVVNTFRPGGFTGPAYGNQAAPTYGSGAKAAPAAAASEGTSAAAPSNTGRATIAAASTARRVDITINGQPRAINTASDADAEALQSLLQQIGDAANRSY